MLVKGLQAIRAKRLSWLQYEFRITKEEALAPQKGEVVDVFGECGIMLCREGMAEQIKENK